MKNIVLVGNPNCGKSTLFNRLTKSKQKIGNYPGVTVEKKEGFLKYKNSLFSVVDLPGIYSLSSHVEEERIVRNYLLENKCDVVINIVDLSNIEKSLFLTTQLMEMGLPIILVCNKIDLAKAHNIEVDIGKLSSYLEVDIVEIIANKGQGIEDLLDKVFLMSQTKNIVSGTYVRFSKDIEKKIKRLEELLKEIKHRRWYAIKLLEEDQYIQNKLLFEDIIKQDKEYEEIISHERHYFISFLVKDVVKRELEKKITLSDKIDKILINKYLGIPIFFILMYLVFQTTFLVGAYPTALLKIFFSKIYFLISNIWISDSLFRSFLLDGVITGVGSVILFLPNILLLFFSLSLLEESGYMARAAFVMDRIMHKVGLHGKSFIPLLIGFGCTVPAVMSTRILENRKDRFTTILALPFICCSAKLVVFTLIIPAFFSPMMSGLVLFSLYFFGIVLAIVFIKILKKTIFKGKSIQFIMEMPNYQIPSLKNIFYDLFFKGWLYLKKAGTIILLGSFILWILTLYPRDKKIEENFKKEIKKLKVEMVKKLGDNREAIEEFNIQSKKQEFIKNYKIDISKKIKSDFFKKKIMKEQETYNRKVEKIKKEERKIKLHNSYIGRIGYILEPIFRPIGFDWKIDTALIGALSAKEIFVSQLSIIFAAEDDGEGVLRERIKESYSIPVALSLLFFVLISAPCIATVAMTKKETGKVRYAVFQFIFLIAFAYLMSFIVYRITII
ncbi:MAG: hypothetical protein AMS24_03855 [Chlamydiae bacterium SM23_39]|nr:MAG: hypothetical protein AMS24_03855 [Chlamydiae bacterium SM23_39]